MSNLPPVDVCVLVKNEVKSIGKCLDSLLANSYPNFRILVCDGRSADGTLEVIQDYAKKHANILLHIQKSSGCGAARQELMPQVNADYVAWTDGGSILDKNWLRELVIPLLNSDEKVAGSGGLNYVISNNSALAQSLGLLPIGMRSRETTSGVACLVGNNVCYKTEILRQNPWAIFLNYGDDLEMSCRLRQKGYNLIAAPNAKAYVRTQETFRSFHNWIKRKTRGEISLCNQCEATTSVSLKIFVNKIKIALLKRLIALGLSILLLMLIILTPYRILLAIILFGLAVLYIIYLFKRRFNSKQLGEKVFKRTYLLFPLIDFLFILLYVFYIWRYSRPIGK